MGPDPDNPNAPIYRDYIDKYARMDPFPGGFNYRRFTITDNPAVTPERLREIEAQYEKGSLWYRRDILGERCAAEWLIFRDYADAPDRWAVPWSRMDRAGRAELLAKTDFLTVGVDFGGSRSLTAFAAAGISRDRRRVWLMADRHIPGGTQALSGSGRLGVRDCCTRTPGGLSGARWDAAAAREGRDVRLDDFTSDVDILDAEEYAWERFFVR